MVAGFLLAREVSDLCIGKPPIRWLPPSSTVARAVAELEADGGPGAVFAVWDGQEGAAVAGRIRMADVLLFLCADDGSSEATLADLLAAAGAPPVRRVEPDASVLEAVDALLGGAQSLVVPIRGNRHRRRSETAHLEAESMCWVTVEDVVRFFLGSVALFSQIALRSVSDLGAVRPARSALAVAPGHGALFAVEPLLRAALATHASVAVVSGRCLVDEISPWPLCTLDASIASSFGDSGRAPREAALRRRNLHVVLDLIDQSSPSSSSSSSPCASCSSSSSEDEHDDEKNVTSAFTSTSRQAKFSARWTKGVIACRRGSSLVAVMAQAVAHRVTQVWVVDDEPEEEELVGVVGLLDVLRVLRRHLLRAPPAHSMADVLEAVDALLAGAQSLVVPIRGNRHRRRSETAHLEAESMCWVTVEDVVRFFLGSVALFSQIALRSVSDLGAVRPARSALAVAPGHDALSAIMPLLRTALATHSSVAVVSGRCLVGEILPWTICSLDASIASFVDSGRTPQEAALEARLRSRNLHGVLDLLNAGGRDLPSAFSSSSSSSSCASSSASSSEDEDEKNVTLAFTSTSRQAKFSARWTKGIIACQQGSSLVAVMAQAVAHRVTQVWVVDDEPGEELVGVGLLDVLRVLRRHLLRAQYGRVISAPLGMQEFNQLSFFGS